MNVVEFMSKFVVQIVNILVISLNEIE